MATPAASCGLACIAARCYELSVSDRADYKNMDALEYLAVLISIILGLGIAQLLGGLGRWVEHRASFRPFAPALIWAVILLLIHVQT